MAEENNDNNEPKLTNNQQIVQHIINKEPSKMKNVVHKEIASKVMDHIETKRTTVGSKMFGV